MDDLSSSISSEEPRFSFFRFESDNVSKAIIFIYTCPSSSRIKERMLYASSKSAILAAVQEQAGLKVDKKVRDILDGFSLYMTCFAL